MKLRDAREEDCRLLWEWVNDSDVRASAFRPEPITWEQHVVWFHGKMFDPNCHIYILTSDDDDPVGQVRFDVQQDGSAEVDISIARQKRGLGYGMEGLRRACAEIVKSARVKRILARIKIENVASVRIFEKIGFIPKGKEIVNGCEAVRMIMDRNGV